MRLTQSWLFMLAVTMLALSSAAQGETLVGHWAMDDNAADNTVLDSSGHSYDGSLYQNDHANQVNMNTEDVSIPGVFGTALDLQNQVWADLTAHIANLKPAGDYTLSLWVKNVDNVLATQQAGHPVFSWDTSNPYYPRFQVVCGYVWDTFGRISSFHASASSGAGYLGTSPQLTTWEADQWHHVALTVEEVEGTNVLKIYQDGDKVAEVMGMFKLFGTGDATIPVPTPGTYPVLDQVHIGAIDLGSLGSTSYGNLPIDDVGLWEGALTEEQIANVINHGVQGWAVPEPSSLVLFIGALALLRFRRRR
ncbi:MAG: LamG domain-containing protein [Pirellulales bacterium]|nr:LamG domain-containing protein [Pirellulales bacterium]